MRVGVLGLGYWGPNLVRNFLAHPEVETVIGCDQSFDRLKFIKEKFPSVRVSHRYDELLEGDIDIIAIATPVDTHYKFAKAALEAGKHIWVEKPFTSESKQAEELIEISRKNNLRIFVDHTFLYNPAVIKIKELVDKGELGDIIYFDSVRINLGLFQNDVNVIWDLVPHDLSIMKHLLPGKEISGVAANGIANFLDHENIAHMSVHFNNNSCFAHFHVNWTSPVKIRRIIVGGSEKMLVYDDMEPSEKIKVYDCGVNIHSKEDIHKALVEYRTGDIHVPKIDNKEALAAGVEEFITAIKEERDPLTDGVQGMEVVRMIEAADISIKNEGYMVKLEEIAQMSKEEIIENKDEKLYNLRDKSITEKVNKGKKKVVGY